MIGIVADDVTGANDIGIMYAKAGWETDVYPFPYTVNPDAKDSFPDIMVIDTNSRLDSEKIAYEKVFQSTKLLESIGCKHYFNKTCSVFRGNIGAEFDAMLDALDESFAVVVLGFPKNGRTTIHQEHFVRGKKLEESNFRTDPVHPTKQSNLVQILQSQTKRKVDHVDVEAIRKGSKEIKAEIARKRANCNYLILDVEDQSSLQVIAQAIHQEKVIAGASGIAEELGRISEKAKTDKRTTVSPDQQSQTGVLCVAGSLTPQTLEQVNYLKKLGYPTIEMETMNLFSAQKTDYLHELVIEVKRVILNGEDVLVHATNNQQLVRETKESGRALGYTNEEISRTVSGSMAWIVSQVAGQTGVNRFLLAGGETSAAICGELGIKGLRVHKEIEPGIPSCINLSSPHSLFVLKSGSFGNPDFFIKAMEHLKGN